MWFRNVQSNSQISDNSEDDVKPDDEYMLGNLDDHDEGGDDGNTTVYTKSIDNIYLKGFSSVAHVDAYKAKFTFDKPVEDSSKIIATVSKYGTTIYHPYIVSATANDVTIGLQGPSSSTILSVNVNIQVAY